jgi:hypothetical protein
MGDTALDDLRGIVVDDRRLRDRLLSAPDRTTFIDLVVEVAAEQGIILSADDVVAGLAEARRQSRERWV